MAASVWLVPKSLVHCFAPDVLNMVRKASVAPAFVWPSRLPAVTPTAHRAPEGPRAMPLPTSSAAVPRRATHCLLPDASYAAKKISLPPAFVWPARLPAV